MAKVHLIIIRTISSDTLFYYGLRKCVSKKNVYYILISCQSDPFRTHHDDTSKSIPSK